MFEIIKTEIFSKCVKPSKNVSGKHSFKTYELYRKSNITETYISNLYFIVYESFSSLCRSSCRAYSEIIYYIPAKYYIIIFRKGR